jgi:hypothetical protein
MESERNTFTVPKSKSVVSRIICDSEIKNANALVKRLKDRVFLTAEVVCRRNSGFEGETAIRILVFSPLTVLYNG